MQAVEEDVEESMDDVMNTVFGDISEQHIDGCFQRLLCDITADPKDFEANQPIKVAVEVSENLSLSPEARIVSQKLLQAVQYGNQLKEGGYGAENCEAAFNQCPFSGQLMDQIISQYMSFSEKY